MKKNLYKIIIFTLVMVLQISVNSFAETYTPARKTLEESKSIELAEELVTKNIGYYIYKNGRKLLNYHIYRDPFYRGKLIYGNPQDIEDIPKYSEKTKRLEYRYLGWNKNGSAVTNSFYPNDVVGGIHPTRWNVSNGTYVFKGSAKQSWMNLQKQNNSIYEYNRKAVLHGNGLEYSDDWSARDFDRGDSEIKTQLLTAAGLYTAGTVKVEHNDNGVKYGTFNTKIIPTERREKLAVNGENITMATIENGQDFEKKENAVKFNMNQSANSMKLDITITSNIESMEPLFDSNMIEKYKLIFDSYKIDNNEKPFNHIRVESSKADIEFTKTLELDRRELKVGENYLSINWRSEIETAIEKPLIQEYTSKVVIVLEEGNTPPKAKIKADSQVFIGDEVKIEGTGEDQETAEENLTYRWSGEIPGLSEKYPNVGGNHTFDTAGNYLVKLMVLDEGNLSSTVTKNIEVKVRGQVLIDMEASIDPAAYTYMRGQNNVEIRVDASGKVIKNNGKVLKSGELTVEELSKDYQKGDRSVVSTQTWEGNNPVSHEFSFNVDTEGKDYTQSFRVTYIASFGDGSTETKEKILECSLGSKEPILPNVAVSAVPNPVRAGDEFSIFSSASDADGEITAQYVSIQHKGDMNVLNYMPNTQRGWMKWYPEDKAAGTSEKKYKISAMAVDSDGLGASAKGTLKVLPPEVNAEFIVSGALKENRKVIIDGTAVSTPKYYPINSFTWDITAVGDEGDIDSLRYDGDLHEARKEILFKKAGKYKIKLHAANEAGYDDEIVKIIEVLPDEVPDQRFSVQHINKSDPSDNNRALLTAESLSYSKDGDYIDRRVWFVTFDSDNDGNYEEEEWYVNTNNVWLPVKQFGITEYSQLRNIDLGRLSKDNKKAISIKVQAVGDYYFEELVIERFGQETIEKFVSQEDRRRNDSFN